MDRYICIYTVQFYSAIKKNEIMSFAGKSMQLEVNVLNQISYIQKDKHCILSFIYRI
jgi:hypothetical protein